MSEKAVVAFGGLSIVAWFAGIAGWITAVVNDAGNSEWGWLIVDLVLGPIGAIRGILMWFGVVG